MLLYVPLGFGQVVSSGGVGLGLGCINSGLVWFLGASARSVVLYMGIGCLAGAQGRVEGGSMGTTATRDFTGNLMGFSGLGFRVQGFSFGTGFYGFLCYRQGL